MLVGLILVVRQQGLIIISSLWSRNITCLSMVLYLLCVRCILLHSRLEKSSHENSSSDWLSALYVIQIHLGSPQEALGTTVELGRCLQ